MASEGLPPVYGPAEPQSEIFGEVRPLLSSLLDGYNVCIMAYGQTGSGKSYTMLGPQRGDEPAVPADADGDCGLVPRVAWELFRLLSEEPTESRQVEVSAVEVYNNNVFDLLAEGGSARGPRVKREVTMIQEGRPEVPLLTCQAVGSAAELLACVRQGLRLRAQQPTLVHASSSRSHLIVTVTLPVAPSSCSGPGSEMKQSSPGQLGSPLLPQKRAGPSPPRLVPRDDGHHGQQEQVWPKLQLVDLAGSECVGDSGVTGLALREASSINRSLAALADVLGALSQRRTHVPYRNSKLTHLLQDSIGGDAKLLVLLCVSPGRKHVAETLQSLAFGARARQVKRGPARRKAPGVPEGNVRTLPCPAQSWADSVPQQPQGSLHGRLHAGWSSGWRRGRTVGMCTVKGDDGEEVKDRWSPVGDKTLENLWLAGWPGSLSLLHCSLTLIFC
ncbi:kinesin-like protein KIF25 [Ochotona curzoniae]|uniref:kinesin-like protein KIF25 n=1 Tax=Ochotona curzoniae TaxID=130825 RepID=UPI001B346D91|nr:kinesin-like protein KIF25 [Ochotona curzoniae]